MINLDANIRTMNSAIYFFVALLSFMNLIASEEISLHKEIASIKSKDGSYFIAIEVQAGALPNSDGSAKVISPRAFLVISNIAKTVRWDYPVGFRISGGMEQRIKISDALDIKNFNQDEVSIKLDDVTITLVLEDFRRLEKAIAENEKRIARITSPWQELCEAWLEESLETIPEK
jgi:hypothetical protein